MKYLFFDTETTGFDPQKDRLVQLAWILTDSDGKYLNEKSEIIRPNGFQIPDGMIHGISDEYARRVGRPVKSVLNEFDFALDNAETVVAHNFRFDCAFVFIEANRSEKGHPITKMFGEKPNICTMRDSRIINHFQLRRDRISLAKLHTALFHQNFENAHDALADTRATARCFFELKKLNVL